MGLIKCPDCGNMVSERAESCPSCGCPVSSFKPDFKVLTAALLGYHLLKCMDRKDLVLAGDCVLSDLKERLNTSFPVTFIGSDNLDEQVARITNKEFSFPYVFITADFRYMLDYLKFPLAKQDGRIYQRYYDENVLPCNYGPKIEIFSDSEQQINEITQKISVLFGELKTYSIPFNENDCLQFNNGIVQIGETKLLIDSIEARLAHRTITLKQSQWACSKDATDDIRCDSIKTLRQLQLAQFCLYFAAMKDECSRQLALYDFIFNSAAADVPYQSKEYKTLKNLVLQGQSFDAALTEQVFPNISLIYHSLPNDLLSRTHVDLVRERVYKILDQYETTWKIICDSYELPCELNVPDWDYSGLSNNMRSTDGLGFLIESLVEDHTAKISDLISDYAQLLAYRGEEGRMESDQRYDEFMEMLHERRERRRDFTRGVLKTAAGVALGNKISDKLKNKD